MDAISKHIRYQEATTSQTATRLGIKNIPNQHQLDSMKLLAENVFEPLREKFGAIRVSSFFRSASLNRAIGGSASSQHCKGEAIDIQGLKVSNAILFNEIKNNLDFDQLIWEFGTSKEPSWVHVSYKKSGNRKQIIKAIRKNGKVSYIPY